MAKAKKPQKAYFKEWEQAMAHGLLGGRPFSEGTINAYSLYVASYLEQYDEVSVQNLKKVLLSTPVNQFGKRYKIYQALRSFASYLIQEGLMDKSYLEEAPFYLPRRHLPPKKTTVTEKEIEALIEASDDMQEKLIIILLAATGLRVSEATNLKVDDINLEERYLTVRLAKWGKTRRVGIINRLAEMIKEYLEQRPVNNGPDKDYLFWNRKGNKMTRYGVRTRLEKIGLRVDVTVTPHSLRRAFVTINANKGRPLPMLQIACGHSNITTTRSYCMTTEDETIEAMQGWD